MIRIEIELSVPGQPVARIANAIANALYTSDDLEDVVVHRITIEEADAT